MAQNQNWGFSAGGGGFLRVLGIIYLVQILRGRRERRELETKDPKRPRRRSARDWPPRSAGRVPGEAGPGQELAGGAGEVPRRSLAPAVEASDSMPPPRDLHRRDTPGR